MKVRIVIKASVPSARDDVALLCPTPPPAYFVDMLVYTWRNPEKV
jgi:hypothetical protein